MHFLFGAAEGSEGLEAPRSLNLFKLYRHHHTRPIESLRDRDKRVIKPKCHAVQTKRCLERPHESLHCEEIQITDVSTVFFFVLLVIKII